MSENKEVAKVTTNSELATNDVFNAELPDFKNAVIAQIADSSSYLSTADMKAGNGFFCCIKEIALGDVPNKQKPIVNADGEIEGYRVDSKMCAYLIRVNPDTGEQDTVHTASKILRTTIENGLLSGAYLPYTAGKKATPLWIKYGGMKSSGAKQIGQWSVHRVATGGVIVN